MLKRVKPYNPIGRTQTEEESDKITDKIVELLNYYNLSYDVEDGWVNGYDNVVEKVMSLLGDKQE